MRGVWTCDLDYNKFSFLNLLISWRGNGETINTWSKRGYTASHEHCMVQEGLALALRGPGGVTHHVC